MHIAKLALLGLVVLVLFDTTIKLWAAMPTPDQALGHELGLNLSLTAGYLLLLVDAALILGALGYVARRLWRAWRRVGVRGL